MVGAYYIYASLIFHKMADDFACSSQDLPIANKFVYWIEARIDIDFPMGGRMSKITIHLHLRPGKPYEQ